MIAEALKYTAYDAVASGVDLDTGLIAVGVGSVADSIGMYRSVLKLYTVGDSLHVIFRYIFVSPYMIYLFLHVFRMSQLRCQVTVICEKKHSCGVAVKTSHRIYTLVTGALYKIHDSSTAVGVIAGSHTIFRLVEKYIALALKSNYLFVIFDHVVVRNLGTELGNDLTVDLYKTLLDEFISLATRAYTGIGHKLVQTYLLVRIGYRHFILDAFRTRNETLALTRSIEAAVAALRTIVVIAALLTVIVVTALTIVVVAALLTIVVAALTIIVVAALLTVVVTALTIVVIDAMLTFVVT